MSLENDPKPYLLGGTGSIRRLSTLTQRYIPKGGHLVDFTTRKIPTRANNTINDAFENSPGNTKMAPEEESNNSSDEGSCVVNVSSMKTLQIRKTIVEQDTPSKKPHNPTKYSSVRNTTTTTTTNKDADELRARQRQWRPPGKPSTTIATHLTSTAALQAKQTRNTIKTHSPCMKCSQTCEKIKKEAEVELQAAKQDRAAANQLRGKLEVALATAIREKKEFEEYKVNEMNKMRQEAAEASRKVHRDRMAVEARRRSALQEQAAWEKEKHDIQALQSMVEELRKNELRYKVEKGMLEKKVEQLESMNAELKDEIRRQRLQLVEQAIAADSSESGSESGNDSDNNGDDDDVTCTPALSSPSSSCSSSTLSSSSATLSHCGVTNQSSSSTPIILHPSKQSTPLQQPHQPPSSIPIIKHFDNNTLQYTFPDGRIITHYTCNGDIKQEYPTGLVEYFFKSVDCWQVTHPLQGIEVFYFPSGQVEAHLHGNIKEIYVPESGHAFKSWPGGDGEVSVSPSLLCKEIFWPKPSIIKV